MSKKFRRSGIALAVLAFLYESPMHPYRMQQLIKQRGKDEVINVRQRASLYQTIDRLLEAGLIVVHQVERGENRPERTVYALTEKGRTTMLAWLRAMLAEREVEFPQFPAALAYLALLAPDDARRQLEQRMQQLAAEIDRVATQTQFNGLNLLDGSFSAQQFQVGANAGQTITISSINSARTSALGQFQGFQLTGQTIGTASDTAAAKSVTVGGVTTSLGTIANDAKALAAAINSSGVAGLSATANATSVAAGTSTDNASASGNATVTVNGVAITVAGVDGNLAQNRANVVAALNAQSSVTGVVATDTGSGVSLAAADGRNITTSYTAGGFTASTVADFGLGAAGTTGATINVTYNAPAGTTGNMTWTGAFDPGPNAIAATGTAISAVDISTSAGANAALTAIDAALTTVNSTRAKLGAIQNRFESTISNLQTTSENLSASRSRIQDTDFAAETALLTRAQILQQAGTAILSQANSVPQNVLTLLR
jgi:flagellin